MHDPQNMYHVALIGLAIGLVLLNGFFVAAEFSIVRLRNTQIHTLAQRHGYRGRLLEGIHHNLDGFLSACQFGITLASLALGWIGEPAFAYLLSPIFSILGIKSEALISTLSIITAFTLITAMHIIIGELAPKSVAIRRSETTALWVALPLYIFYVMLYPFIWLFNGIAIFLLEKIGLSTSDQTADIYSTDELKLIINASQTQGQIATTEREILKNTLDFTDLKIADLMQSVDEMIVISLSDPIEKIIATMIQHRYSRYPESDERSKNIIGIIHVKELFAHWHTDGQITQIKPLMHPILSVAPEAPVIDLFGQFRQGHAHFAIVKNECDTTIGYVTLDNILSAILGNIHDEFNQVRGQWIALNSGAFLMKGSSPIYALEKALSIELPDDYHTISGLIIDKLERLPQVREKVEFEHFDITIRKMQGPNILLVKITPHRDL